MKYLQVCTEIFLLVAIIIILTPSIASSIPISVVPDKPRPSSGDNVTVDVYVDFSGRSDLLGEYSLEVTWDHTVLAYQEVLGGTTEGFTTVISNATKAGEGILLITHVYPQGAGNRVHIARITFAASNSPGAETTNNLRIISISAAITFENLETSCFVIPATITINSPPAFITTGIQNASIGIPYKSKVEIRDPDKDDTHFFELVEGPDWMSINSETGELSGTPDNRDVDSNISVIIKVVDAGGLEDTLRTTINVTTNYIIITEPHEGSTVLVNMDYEIKWNYSGVSNIKIELSIDGGINWEDIEKSIPASNGSYIWRIPDKQSKNCNIRISDITNSTVEYKSGIFSIIRAAIFIERINPILQANQNETIDFSIKIISDTNINEVKLYWDTTGERIFDNQITMESQDGEVYTSTLAEGLFTSDGIEYYVEATDITGERASSPEDSTFYSIAAVVEGVNSDSPVPSGSAQTAYRMISVPLEPFSSSIIEQLKDKLPGGEKGYDWRLFRFSPGSETPNEYPDIEGFHAGAAFWLIAKNGFTLEAPKGSTVTTEKSFRIELKPGWNDIANPWGFDISWKDMYNPSNADIDGPFTYEDKWSSANPEQIMEPWKGYAVRNMTNRPVLIFLTPNPASPTPKKVTDTNTVWTLSLKASTGEATDSENYLGIKSDASHEWDQYDHVEPPTIGEFVSVHFPHGDWTKYPYDYSVDMRSPNSVLSWNFDVATNISNETVCIEIGSIGDIPKDYTISIFDRENDHSVRISDNIFSFLSGNNGTERHFKLVVSNTGINKNQASRPECIITTFCYPNPFNPQTTIHYELSQQGTVTLLVYNMLGQTVYEKGIGYKDKGIYEFIFDASMLTSGLYLYRIFTLNSQGTGKMLYLK